MIDMKEIYVRVYRILMFWYGEKETSRMCLGSPFKGSFIGPLMHFLLYIEIN